MTPHVNEYSGMDTTFSYPFCKYQWISNATRTRTRTRRYRLVLESVPNGFFTYGYMDNGHPLPSLAAPPTAAAPPPVPVPPIAAPEVIIIEEGDPMEMVPEQEAPKAHEVILANAEPELA
jgi:hypothetical protein